MFEQIYASLQQGFIAISLLMFIFWLTQYFTKNAGVVDVGWALSLAVLVSIYAVKTDGHIIRKLILLNMVTFWALRLAGIFARKIATYKTENTRYQYLRRTWGAGAPLKFFFLFGFKTFLSLILSLPFLLVCLNPRPEISIFEILGLLIWIAAFAGEITTDEQLHEFKSNPINKGLICREGLWKYSRHPNYFCEFCVWIGYFIFACGSPYGWISIISPAIMYWMLTKVTGIPLAEKISLETRGDFYREYQSETNAFFPNFKKGNLKEQA